MIQNRRAYQLIHCRTRSRLLAGAAAVCGAACGHADLGLYHLLHRGGAPLPDSTQADRAALAALCPKPAAEETCPLLPPQDPAVTLSVIVPVYNGEATIGPCLDSILQQETSCTVQLIVVDSDSTDGTAAVLERYRALPGVLLCNCSAPRSAAAARNEGLRHAVGRWLMFVDSDDLLLPGAIRTLLEAAQRLDADVVQGGWQYLYTDGTHGPVQRYPAAVYTGAAAPERFELPGMPWGKVYRRELFAQVTIPALRMPSSIFWYSGWQRLWLLCRRWSIYGAKTPRGLPPQVSTALPPCRATGSWSSWQCRMLRWACPTMRCTAAP